MGAVALRGIEQVGKIWLNPTLGKEAAACILPELPCLSVYTGELSYMTIFSKQFPDISRKLS